MKRCACASIQHLPFYSGALLLITCHYDHSIVLIAHYKQYNLLRLYSVCDSLAIDMRANIDSINIKIYYMLVFICNASVCVCECVCVPSTVRFEFQSDNLTRFSTGHCYWSRIIADVRNVQCTIVHCTLDHTCSALIRNIPISLHASQFARRHRCL